MANELKLEETKSLVLSVPDELVDSGRIDWVVLVQSDKVLVVVLIDSTEDSRYDSLGGPLLLLNASSCLGGNTRRSLVLLLLLVFCPTPAPPPVALPLGVSAVVVDAIAGLLLEA